MRQIAGILSICLMLIACGPSAEERAAMEKAKLDSILASDTKFKGESNKQEEKVKKYFLANQFDLVPGTIVGWAPTDEVISTWKSNGGVIPDRVIYVHIQDQYGMVTVLKCNNMAWLNLHTGDVLR